MVRFRLLAAALALVAAGAQAQLVPGTREPASAAEATVDAQEIVCTLAAAGRPMGGLNIPLVGGEGYVPVDKAPESLLRFVPASPPLKIVEYKGSGGPLWIAYDPASGRCAIYAFADPGPVETELGRSLDQSGLWKRKEAAAGDPIFEWKAEPGLRLQTRISRPRAEGDPIVVVVEPVRR